MLIEFASAVNAVQCAVDLQHGMAAANGDQTDDHRIVLRIGVNLGDVMVEGSDLYGDGVNVAARLEALAEPGGILISGTAYDYVRNKIKVGFDDLRPSNAKEHCRTGPHLPGHRHAGRAIARNHVRRDRQTVDRCAAIYEYERRSGAGVLLDGITEDIITDLSQVSALFVVARNTLSPSRANLRYVQTAKPLHVGHILEGSVRKAGGRVESPPN